jgi:hypothetical protein
MTAAQPSRPGTAAARIKPVFGADRNVLALGLLVLAFGLLLVSVSYAGGRTGTSGAQVAFWIGQLLIFVPAVAWLLARRHISDRQSFGLAIAQAVVYFGVEYCYRPLQFRFPDELQHWRTATNMLATHHLFTTNYSLPISPRYPGLENVTVAVAVLLGTSVFVSGLLVVLVSRVLLTIGLYLLFRRMSGSPWIAGLACVLYTTTFYYKSILAMFVYSTVALPFMVLALYAAVRLTDTSTAPQQTKRQQTLWWVLGMAAIAVTVVSHHVTSYVMLLALLIALALSLLRRDWRVKAPILAVYTTIAVATAELWSVLVAPSVGIYLGQSPSNLFSGLGGLLSTHHNAPTNGGTLQNPLPDRVLSYAGMLAIVILLPIGWRRLWRVGRTRLWMMAAAVGSVSFFPIMLLRVVSDNGAEYAGTALAYASMPIGFVLAYGIAEIIELGTPRLANLRLSRPRLGRLRPAGPRRGAAAVAGATAVATLVMLASITSGWPPYWERLPGKTRVSGFESSVTAEGIASARWAHRLLGPGNRFAADEDNYTLLGTYGDEGAVRGTGGLYYSRHFRPADRKLVAETDVRYLLTDRRLTRQLPASGSYFPDDPRAGQHTRPLPKADLTKFNHVAGIRRIYDSGNIVIYDLRGSRYEP